jgi:hypothetical protein
MFTDPPLRVLRLVREAVKNSNANHVLEEINQANIDVGSGYRISRSLMRGMLSNPDGVAFTRKHLVALHIYFRATQGISFQHTPILESRGIYEALGDKQRLVFMYGAKPRPEEQRTDNSRWDTRSNGELIQQFTLAGGQHKIESMDVLWSHPVDPAVIRAEPWFHVIEDDQASIVSIGSPLAALSSEVIMARMFGVTPFMPPKVTKRHQVPFFFVWLHKIAADFRSAFGLSVEDLETDHPSLSERVQSNASTAVVIGDEVRESPTLANEWTMYGIIAAQRRAAGNVWLVVAGLHGPATFGAATVVKDICEELPWPSKGKSTVLWVPVKVLVRAGQARATDGDIREVVKAELEGSPRFWTPPV